MQDSTTQRQALLPSTSQCPDQRVLAPAEARHVDCKAHTLTKLGMRYSVNSTEETQVLFHREVTIEGKLLRHVSNALANAFGVVRDIDAGDHDAAGGRSQQSAKNANDC
jgi:hypothetical protein